MTGPVKRRYDATARRERAAGHRRAAVGAARELLLAEGYAATTVPAVAGRAGVSAEFVYKNVGGRVALLSAVLDAALGGDVPMAARPEIAELRRAPDAATVLAGYVRFSVGVQQQVAPLLVAARAAAATDAGAAEVLAKADRERLAGMTGLARHLLGLGGLRADLTPDRVRDVLWTATAAELWDLLVTRRGWDAEDYGDFVLSTLRSALLEH
jgi:AcrR family transcriptional regulator